MVKTGQRVEDYCSKGSKGTYRSCIKTRMGKIRVDEHITLIFAVRPTLAQNVGSKEDILSNAVGKISYEALTGTTCSIVGLILKIEQNVIFSVTKTIGRALGNTTSFSLLPKPMRGTLKVFF